ncbi:MAG: pseudouridine synthase [Akkermansiaceae bacterium]|nr:pseudouridine synthase [Akkermansiaceae bacterium]
MTEGIRLNKYLASCAVGSRRACDELIQAGRVEINGSSCSKLATRILPGDHVKVDGRRVIPREPVVVVFHKPRGYVCTRADELGRATIYDVLPVALHSLHHVGRLDMDSEGLLILTNDGELSQRLMHPSKAVDKEYLVTANQAFESTHLDQFLLGVYAEGTKLRAKEIERLSARRIRVVLDHGAKRQIRVMFETLGYTVTKLLRVRIGQLWLGDLAPAQWAILTSLEIGMLLGDSGAQAKTKAKKPGTKDGKKPKVWEVRKPAPGDAKETKPTKERTGRTRAVAKPAPARKKYDPPPPTGKRRTFRTAETRNSASGPPARKGRPPARATGRGPQRSSPPPSKAGPPRRRAR